MASETGSSSETVTIEESNSPEQPNPVNRRSMIKKAGMFLGAASALAALGTPAAADTSEECGENVIEGLWAGVVSAADNSFPLVDVWDLWGPGIYISSGQTDLSPSSLTSSAWQVYKRVGPRMYQTTGRVWTYDQYGNPTGYQSVSVTFTVSKDGKTYHGVGPVQAYDTNGNPVGAPITIYDDGTRVA